MPNDLRSVVPKGPKTVEDLIEDILKREGRFVNNPVDKGGRTDYGISEVANPEAWKDDKVTLDEAKAIYVKKYVEGPGFLAVPDDHLRAQLVDFGVNSGPLFAIQKLQIVLGVPQDGKLGPNTLEALAKRDPREVSNLLMAERLRMFARIVQRSKNQAVFLAGWVNRALDFLLP